MTATTVTATTVTAAKNDGHSNVCYKPQWWPLTMTATMFNEMSVLWPSLLSIHMKGRLKSFEKYVAPYIYNSTIDTDIYKATLNILHTFDSLDGWSNNTRNNVLGTLPPDICASETELPRPVRTTLAQLHSRYCRQLNTLSHTSWKVLDIFSLSISNGITQTGDNHNCPVAYQI